MADERKLKVQEVAVAIDASVQTINGWYKFKKENPDNELAKLLPDYTREESGKRTRYWNQSDIWKMIQFKKSIPQGCRGVMGSVTQRYCRKKSEKEQED